MSQPRAPESAETEDDAEDIDRAELETRVEVLEEENSRLRSAYAAAQRTQYRRSALGLAAVGIISGIGGLLLPGARTVLFALAGIGGFGAILTYYLTPERFVAASVVEHVQRATGTTYGDLVDELGLQATRVYVPSEGPAGPAAWLFIPQHAEYRIPDTEALQSRFVVPDDRPERGLSIVPAGAGLFDAVERSLSGNLADEPGPLADQLADAIVEQFELADAVETDRGDARLTVSIEGPTLENVADVDHPIVSFLGVGTAVGLGVPVTVDVETAGDDPVVTLRWDEGERSEA